MTDKIAFDLVSPERLLVSAEAEMITIPGSEGEMGVMAGHAPVISTLRPGIITVQGGSDGRFYVTGGFVEVTPEKLTVLAEEAVPMGELDAGDLDHRIEEAEKALAGAEESDKATAQSALERLVGMRAALGGD
jgi:F-type H+-transporting ATPase subunit epsilon